MKETQYCSCCLSQECYKDVWNEHLNGRTQEVFEEMLYSTFNIKISNSGCNSYLICDTCITKLREATEFKEQVLRAQSTISNGLSSSELNLQLKIKVEDIDNFNDKSLAWDNKQDSQTGQVFVIKVNSNNALSNKVSKIQTSKCNRTKLKSNKAKVKKDNSDKDMKKLRITIKGKPKARAPEYEAAPIMETEVDARANTLNLIENSNLCLFRSLKTKFGCFMCKASFVELLKLREHYKTHTNTSFLASRVSKWRGLSYKNADISDLKCSKCLVNITDLTQLIKHLNDTHNIQFNGSNSSHFLIPYKLADGNKCVLCDSKFNTFLRLAMHMNSHYTNNVCENCGLSFINRMSLRMHVQSMHREKKCSKCPAKFLTIASKVAHLKKVHNISNKKRYCNLCEKIFPYTYMLAKHKIEEHGAKKTVTNCSECGKTFFHEANLKVHVRSVHIRERNYPCDVCGTRFFTKCDKKRHEKTHNDVRSFSCSNCDAKFKSKDSWRRHMKRQHGHVFS